MLIFLQTSLAKATTQDENITEEIKNYINGENYNSGGISLLDYQSVYNFTTWRSENILLKRTSTSTGITVEVNNWGTHYIDVAIFNTSYTLIGTTQTANAGQTATLTWISSDLKENPSSVYLFITMYAEYYNPVTVTVTY